MDATVTCDKWDYFIEMQVATLVSWSDMCIIRNKSYANFLCLQFLKKEMKDIFPKSLHVGIGFDLQILQINDSLEFSTSNVLTNYCIQGYFCLLHQQTVSPCFEFAHT